MTVRIEWCDDLLTRVTNDCANLKRVLGHEHSHRWIEVPAPVTYERAKQAATGSTPPFKAIVLDAGGGMVTLSVDRDTESYPAIGSRVAVYPITEANQ